MKKTPRGAPTLDSLDKGLSVVVPIHNESENIKALIAEIAEALRPSSVFEVIVVDDASQDDSLLQLQLLKNSYPELRVLQHHIRCGQSSALRSGVRAARFEWVATLDGDGQNDPADILKLLHGLSKASPAVKMLAGWRTARKDSWNKRFASIVANRVRAFLLSDATPDTGCGLKLFEREAFLDLPFFDHFHRYLPALMQRAGHQTISVPVNHRARTAGVSKYNNLGRLLVAFSDLRGVAWLVRRAKVPKTTEL